MRKGRFLGVCISGTVIVLGLGLMEILLRVTTKRPELSNERNTLYRYDSELGWRPKPLFQGTYSYEPGQPVRIQHNAMGFRDREHGVKRGPVLIVLGDSYVYGFNVNQEEQFTDVLRQKMPAWDIYNFGVSGYGTDQEYLLLKNLLPPIQPDVVLVIVCSNDHDDNTTNRRYGYYKPYFDIANGRLELRGVPVPKTLLYYPATFPFLFRSLLVTRAAEMVWRPIAKTYWPTLHVADPTGPLLLQMRDDVERSGARFLVGFMDYGPEEKSFCAARHLNGFRTNSAHVYKTPGGHWDPKGHRDVAEQVFLFLHSLYGIRAGRPGIEAGSADHRLRPMPSNH